MQPSFSFKSISECGKCVAEGLAPKSGDAEFPDKGQIIDRIEPYETVEVKLPRPLIGKGGAPIRDQRPKV
jgi:hypothetical protein